MSRDAALMSVVGAAQKVRCANNNTKVGLPDGQSQAESGAVCPFYRLPEILRIVSSSPQLGCEMRALSVQCVWWCKRSLKTCEFKLFFFLEKHSFMRFVAISKHNSCFEDIRKLGLIKKLLIFSIFNWLVSTIINFSVLKQMVSFKLMNCNAKIRRPLILNPWCTRHARCILVQWRRKK